jgi:DNA-binding transcriptional MerR regulator
MVRAKPLDLQDDSKVYPAIMTATLRIAEVADRSGFSPATLRYYEQLDLLPPPRRTATGYRAYDESVLARLAFDRPGQGAGLHTGGGRRVDA